MALPNIKLLPEGKMVTGLISKSKEQRIPLPFA